MQNLIATTEKVSMMDESIYRLDIAGERFFGFYVI